VLGAHLDPKSGYYVLRIETLPDLDDFAENLTHAIADVAGQIRSSLDKLAWTCACSFAHGTPKDLSGVKFPICDTQTDWINARRARNQLDPAHCGFIEQFQPYHGVCNVADSYAGAYVHQLTLLRDLSNYDKHRDTAPALLTQGCFLFRDGITIAKKTGPYGWDVLDIDPTGIGKPMELGKEVMRARLIDPPQGNVDDAGRAVPLVEIGEGRIADHTMQRLHRFVHFLLSEFARQFP
jgi:hypothetical protein